MPLNPAAEGGEGLYHTEPLGVLSTSPWALGGYVPSEIPSEL